MKTMRWLLLLIAVPCFGQSVQGQSLRVSGLVTDSTDGTPLPGVGVLVKNGQLGTATDAEGRFQLDGVPPDAILVFSFVGYKTAEEPLRGRSILNKSLELDMQSLEEVVVVGYGTQRKINVTGAIDQLSGEELKSRPVANIMQGLQGMSPGLNITYGNGSPGSIPNLNVRGTTSINGGSPLIVIDGIPVADAWDMIRLNPNDIASYTVLRDAASAAIYGARATYGVILITTKSGEEGRQSVTYNVTTSWGRPTELPDPVTDPYIFSRVLENSTLNTPWNGPTYVDFNEQHYQWAKERSDDPSLPEVRIDPSDPN